MKKHNPEDLIHNYVNGTSSEEERIIVESWHIQEVKDSTYFPSKEAIIMVQDRMWSKLTSQIHHQKNYVGSKKLWPKIALTALVFLISAVAIYFQLQPSSQISTTLLIQNDVAPGGNKATLILNNGKRVSLLQDHKKLIATQEGVNILGSKGLLIYSQGAQKSRAVAINKLETPRGGKYQLLLPDGTRVWLNSASILTYPTFFTGKERKVSLEGEAYFEVAKDKERVFRVSYGTQTIEVLGTHFNIRSYKDEHGSQITLAEGKVKILIGLIHKTLKPGQAAFTNNHSNTIEVENTDLEKDLAWKNNEFIFNGDDLKSIMREVSRWYDVEVVYDENIKQSRYWGVVSRSKNISEVLKMLQLTGKINFKIEGRRITLMN